jgi:hypothetical protein
MAETTEQRGDEPVRPGDKRIKEGDRQKVARMAGRALADRDFAWKALRTPQAAAAELQVRLEQDTVDAIVAIDESAAMHLRDQLNAMLPDIEPPLLDAVGW